MKKMKNIQVPDSAQLEAELNREKYKRQYKSVLRSTVYTLITVSAIAILVATLWLPVFQIYGASMTPTLENGDIVASVKTDQYSHGDVIAFYYNNKILVKRVIATAGEWIDMDLQGNVYVNGKLLEESYIEEKSFGQCNLELPYQVPESRVFVMGDHRDVSIDSRHTSVGCVSEEQIVGKLKLRIWPLNNIQIF